MIPDWQTLVAPRPLTERAVRLALEEPAWTAWFAHAGLADFAEVSPGNFLTRAESLRAGVFKSGQPRDNFSLGRLSAKLALVACVEEAHAPGINHPLIPNHFLTGGEVEGIARKLRVIEITNGSHGEPMALAPVDCEFGVSLSHVNGRGVAVAFPRGQKAGVDLELIDARRAETVRKAVPLSSFEEAWLRSVSLPEVTALLLLWTAREALGKALGCGLACPWETLALAEIRPGESGTWVGRYAHQPALRCRSWIGPDCVLSVAWAGQEA